MTLQTGEFSATDGAGNRYTIRVYTSSIDGADDERTYFATPHSASGQGFVGQCVTPTGSGHYQVGSTNVFLTADRPRGEQSAGRRRPGA
jgi:hypothetical protein